jgi:hypothetical protein
MIERQARVLLPVMAGLDPAIQALRPAASRRAFPSRGAWMTGSSPVMTNRVWSAA